MLCLLAQLPLWSIEDLVAERMNRRHHAVTEVASAWGDSRLVFVPYLEIPVVVPGNGDASDARRTHVAVVATQAGVDLRLEPEVRRRGLFDVIVHRAGVDIAGSFLVPDATQLAEALGVGTVVPDWAGARLVLDVDSSHALEGDATSTIDDLASPLVPDRDNGLAGPRGGVRLVADAPVSPGDTLEFTVASVVRGQGEILVVPGALDLDVAASSTWPSPSFMGAFLPVTRDVAASGFAAHWSLSAINTGLANLVTGASPSVQRDLSDAAFGVALIEPVDAYRMVERAVKYGLLFVATTFLVYVMFEVTGGVAVHVAHYALVAMALCLFYVLLLSLAEVWGFGPAYLASTAAVIVQTGLFTRSAAGGWRRSAIFAGVLGACYGWLYVLLDLEDFALLGGALGLFVLLSAAMYVLRGLGRPAQ